MGGISSMLGLGGGYNGTGATIQNSVTPDQTNNAYNLSTQALQQQQAFTQAAQQAGLGGLQNQQNVYNQLAGIANGTGPNPAAAQLAQSTGANVANQAALMAGQRGASQNIGLMARQIAQQGAATQQQAAGQAATLQANQSLNALQGMGSLATQQAGQAQQATAAQTQGSLGLQSNLLNALSSQNSTNGQLAQTSMGQQASLIGNITGGIGSGLQSLFAKGGQVPQRFVNGGPVQPGSGTYAPMDQDPWSDNSQNMSTGPATPPNVPPTTAPNLPSPSNSSANPNSSPNAPKSAFGKFLNNLSSSKTAGNSQKPTDLSYAGQSIGNLIGTGIKNIFSGSNSKPSSDSSYDQYTGSGFTADQMSNESSRNAAIQAGGIPQPDALDQAGPAQTPQQMSASNDNGMPMIAKGGKVPVLLSPGEKKLTPKQAEKVAKGGKVKGKIVPGKAPIPDDKNHYENDVVKDNAEPGTIILPRSVTQSKHPHWAAHQFVSQLMAKQGKMPNKKVK